MTSPGRAAPSTRWWRSARFWFFALPTVTGGLAAWVPPVWIAGTVHDTRLKARLYVIGAVTAAMAVCGGTLVGVAPVDEDGQSPGALDDVGSAFLLVAIAVGTWTAISHRDRVFARPDHGRPGAVELPGVQQALARRDLRRQYQGLAADDPVLAAEIGVGRPDRRPALDDGGLLDLNTLDADVLQQLGRLTPDEAASVVETRQQLGRLSSVDELVVHGRLSSSTADRLRELTVFLH